MREREKKFSFILFVRFFLGTEIEKKNNKQERNSKIL